MSEGKFESIAQQLQSLLATALLGACLYLVVDYLLEERGRPVGAPEGDVWRGSFSGSWTATAPPTGEASLETVHRLDWLDRYKEKWSPEQEAAWSADGLLETYEFREQFRDRWQRE